MYIGIGLGIGLNLFPYIWIRKEISKSLRQFQDRKNKGKTFASQNKSEHFS